MFENKYQLKRDESIFLAKKTLVENIYNQAKMENINITFPDTKTIIDGMSVSGLKTDDVQKVLNLRNAWHYVLEDVFASLDLDYIKTIHAMVAYGELPQHGTVKVIVQDGKVIRTETTISQKIR